MVRIFQRDIPKKEKTVVLNRYFKNSEVLSNNIKGQPEDDINSWGYLLLSKGEIQKALETFKLNVFLHPGSWNA